MNYFVRKWKGIEHKILGFESDRYTCIECTKEFNQRMIPDFMKRMGGRTFLNDAIGVSPSQYEKYKPGSKYEALVE